MIKTFKMKLYPGMEEEYERRHNELWPEMIDMIHAHGGRNYTIALDPDTLTLFGYIEIDDPERVGRRRRYGHQPEVVGLHGRHHGDQRGQLAGLDGLARALPFGLACRREMAKRGRPSL